MDDEMDKKKKKKKNKKKNKKKIKKEVSKWAIIGGNTGYVPPLPFYKPPPDQIIICPPGCVYPMKDEEFKPDLIICPTNCVEKEEDKTQMMGGLPPPEKMLRLVSTSPSDEDEEDMSMVQMRGQEREEEEEEEEEDDEMDKKKKKKKKNKKKNKKKIKKEFEKEVSKWPIIGGNTGYVPPLPFCKPPPDQIIVCPPGCVYPMKEEEFKPDLIICPTN